MGLRESGGGGLPAGVGRWIQAGVNRGIYRAEKENCLTIRFIHPVKQGKENRPGLSPGRLNCLYPPRSAPFHSE